MSEPDVTERVEKLRAELHYHNHRYYVLDATQTAPGPSDDLMRCRRRRAAPPPPPAHPGPPRQRLRAHPRRWHVEEAPEGPTRLEVLKAQREWTAADVALHNVDGTFWLVVNDTFSYVTADGEEIPDSEVARLAHLYNDHGWDALMVWAEDKRGRIILKGDVPSPRKPPAGCVFHTRCPIAIEDCQLGVPELREINKDHWVACIRVDGYGDPQF